jgi:hypothetical protein
MEKFDNLTSNLKEKAFKIGKTVPSDAAPISYFVTEEVSPGNNISILDLSDTILENSIKNINDNVAQVAYADEFGILHSLDGDYSYPSDDLTVSDLFLSKPTGPIKFNVSDINPSDFVHSYYVSKFFTAASSSFSLISIREFVNDNNLEDLKIKVVDFQGNDYIDSNTGLKKYRILLEPFKTSNNEKRSEVPCRVVVLLDSDSPINLQLIYDKIESDEFGNFYNQILRYSETINAVPLYEEIPEESFLVDPNYDYVQQFSIKKIDKKYSEINSKDSIKPGNQIFVPKKAIKDYRTFEAFNWRLIARSKRNINFDYINYGLELDSLGNIQQKTVKVGVLYAPNSDSIGIASGALANPYIFHRLENSPFNLSKFKFINPKAGTVKDGVLIEKNQSAYWTVNIDQVDNLSDYDILAWSPTSKITATQAQKLNAFLAKSGTLILDLSYGVIDAGTLNVQLKTSFSPIQASYLNPISTSKVIDPNKNGGWNLDSTIFEKENYNIVGSNYSFRNSEYKKYYYFNNNSSVNSFVNIGSEVNPVSIGLVLEYASQGDVISKGNIIATAFPLLSYCNDIYSLSKPEEIVNTNNGPVAVQDGDENIYSGILEGPFKLFYNAISYGLYSKAAASRNIDIRSSLFNFVTPWSSSWVMDSAALFDDEKADNFSIINIDSSTQIHGRDLVKNSDSLFEFYKSELGKFLPSVQQSILAGLSAQEIEFYIECTNIDVDFLNGTKVSFSDLGEENIPSSYNLVKISDPLSKVYAYTLRPSAQLTAPTKFGPYAVINQNLSVSESSKLSNELSVLNNFKSYPFDLTCRYSYAAASDRPSSFDVVTKSVFEAYFNGKAKYIQIIQTPPPSSEPISTPPPTSRIMTNVTANVVNIKSAIDDKLGFFTVNKSSNPANTYLYSGDIDIHKDSRIWNIGDKHEFVKYIQYSMVALGGYTVKVDGYYGSQTANAVKAFQTAQNQIYKDGTVDSETKSYIAFAWKSLKNTNPVAFNNFKNFIASEQSILKYIQAAEDAPIASDINFKTYKKLSFSGFKGPSSAKDIFTIEIPTGIDYIDKIVIEPDSDPVWRNYVLDVYGYSNSAITNIFNANPAVTSISAKTGNIEINMGGIELAKAKYMWFQLTGSSLGSGFGFAEGFSIRSIKVYGRVWSTVAGPPIVVDPPSPIYRTIVVTKDVNIKATIAAYTNSSVSVYSPTVRHFDTTSILNNAYVLGLSFKDEYGVTRNFNFDEGELSMGSVYDDDSVTVDFGTSPTVITQNSAVISNVSSQNKTITGNPVDITFNSNSYTLQTSSVYFSGSLIFTVLNNIRNFYTRNLNGQITSQGINTVTVNDGVVLICNQNGAPFGLIPQNQIAAAISNSSQYSQQETDLRFGYLILNNILPEDAGFIYGFYDIVEKEFLGKTISYIDYINRGVANIFIAVCAIDADGNTQNKNEFIGPIVDMTFKPVNIPFKTIVPIFSVKYKNNSAIRIGTMASDTSKFDVWELPITNGAFTKDVLIEESINWLDWKYKYKGQTLSAVYSTLNTNISAISKIYGSAYTDIYDESPVLIDDKNIRLRKTPLLAWNHKTNYKGSIVGIVRPELYVYIRENINANWVRIKDSQIRDINCYSGVVEFISRIIPNDPDLIKVSYTTQNKDKLIKHVDGVPVPLNPVLNANSIIYNKPLFIYIVPESVYALDKDFVTMSNLSTRYVKVNDYVKADCIRFTYDGRIFDKQSFKYDPFALPIGMIYVTNNPYNKIPALTDIRVRGGGIDDSQPITKLMDMHFRVTSHWDVYPPSGKAYAKGGYVIIRIPSSVNDHFLDKSEIHKIIRNNLTAGVVYDLQDLDGNSWSY